MRRDLVLGIAMAAGILWLTFFGTAGTVIAATLVAGVAVLIWFSTVDPGRLLGADGRPQLLLFGLTGVLGGLVVTAAVVISTPTVFVVGAVVVAAAIVGLVRSLRAAMEGA